MTGPPLLRVRDGEEARVTNEELFFDLIYAFAVTQLSHRLLDDLSTIGAVQTLILWFAVWLGWQYTCWVTNWFNPQMLAMRFMLFAVMAFGLLVAAAIPQAYGTRGLVFAGGYAAMQIGRTLFVLARLGRTHPLSANFTRILGWLCISGVFWISGGVASGQTRLALWATAVGCEYIAPMFGFWLPAMGRSRTRDWTIDGGHIAERCQLFVMMALGESVLVTGASISHAAQWSAPVLIALLVTFVINISLWWIYFDTSSRDGTDAIARSSDPGRLAASYHYLHVVLIAGIIVVAVGNELIIALPGAPIQMSSLAVLIVGPLLYLLGNGLYKKFVYGRIPISHVFGALALVAVATVASLSDRLMIGGLAALVLIAVAAVEGHRFPLAASKTKKS